MGEPAIEASTAAAPLPDQPTVLHVSSAHRVSDGRIAGKEAAALCAAGYGVTVLGLERAAAAHLPKGPHFVEYGSPVSRARRFLVRLPWLAGHCLRHRYDAYHLHDPDLVLLGWLLKLARRRVVYDVHEAYPMVVLDREWIPPVLRPLLSRLWRKLESAFVRRADLTVVAHHTVAQQFDGGTIITVQNFPVPEDLAPARHIAMERRPLRVIYHGDLTEQRGLLTMMDAVAQLDNRKGLELRLGGSLSPAMAERIAGQRGLRQTRYLGWLGRQRLAEELALARAGLVLLHPTNNYLKIRPNKLFEYMAAGLPVVASDFPHWRDVVEGARCGILVDPLDSSAIARAVEYLITHPDEAAAMGARGREAARALYNWRSERETLLKGYRLLFHAEDEAALCRPAIGGGT